MEPDLLEWMADQAMYRAKAAGRNGWTWHAPMAQG
jgi:GGDEF domain-containing protein